MPFRDEINETIAKQQEVLKYPQNGSDCTDHISYTDTSELT